MLFAIFHDFACCADDGKSLGVLLEGFEACSALELHLEVCRVAVEAGIEAETVHACQSMPRLLLLSMALELTMRILLAKLTLGQHALACLII